MKIMISADMEGLSGVSDARMVEAVFPEFYAQGLECLTHDINAAIRGLRRAGSPEIDVLDLHGDGTNIIPEKLEPGVSFLGGFQRWVEMMRSGELRGRYDGWIQLGMHSTAGTVDGFISHTNGTNFALRHNGQPVGEIEEFAWSAGHFGIPTLFVAGDDAAAREAECYLPGVKTVVVKTSRGRTEADCLPLDETATLIEAAAAETFENLDAAQAYTITTPVRVEVIFADPEMTFPASLIPRSEVLDEVTLAYTAQDYIEALHFVFAAAGSSNSISMGPMLERLSQLEGAREAIYEYWVEWGTAWLTQPPPFPVVRYEKAL